MAAFLARVTPGQIGEAVRLLESDPDPALAPLRRDLWTAWAARDPSAALAGAAGLGAGRRNDALGPVLEVLAQSEPRMALAYLRRGGPEADRGWQAALVLGRMAESDPRGALQAARELAAERPPATAVLLGPVLRTWAMRDPEAAAKAAMEVESLRWRGEMVQAVMESWGGHDDGAALRWLQALPEGPARTQALAGLVRGVAGRDPMVAARLLESVPTGPARDDAVRQLGSLWARTDPAAALQWIQTLPPNARYNGTIGDILGRIAATDPTAAVDAALQLDGAARERSMQQVFAEINLGDPAQVLALVDRIPPGLRGRLVAQQAGQLGAVSPELAQRVALKLDAESRRGFYAGMAAGWAQQDPAAAKRWFDGTTDPAVREAVAAPLVGSLAWNDPQGALAVAASLARPELRQRVTVEAASVWARSQPEAAASWSLTQQDDAVRQSALMSVMGQWAVNDSFSASAWLKKLPPGPARDAAVAGFASRMVSEDPEVATLWAADIRNAETGSPILQRAVVNWLQADREAASRWLAKADLPPETKQQLEATAADARSRSPSRPYGRWRP